MTTPTKLLNLVEHFERNLDVYKRADYKESRVRVEFVALLFEALVIKGYALVMSIPPNVRYANRFQAAERGASDGKVRLWGGCP